MAVAIEGAKLVTAGWLARRWRTRAWVWLLVLVALVADLAISNAAGVYWAEMNLENGSIFTTSSGLLVSQ